MKLNQPFVSTMLNYRGGNDAWGTVGVRDPNQTDSRALQDVINPGLLEVRVPQGVDVSKRRIDGTPLASGEPLLKKRFALERLAWVTARGPSALLSPSDQLYNKHGTAANVLAGFGLVWTTDQSTGDKYWVYDHGKTGGIYTLEELTILNQAKRLPREPDFFELLKATIAAGSLGKSALAGNSNFGHAAMPGPYNHARDRKVDFQIFDIAANIIDQYDSDSYPTVIKVPTNSPAAPNTPLSPPLYVARGIENLPYIYRFHWRGVVDSGHPAVPDLDALHAPFPKEITTEINLYNNFSAGVISMMGFPELWNPHALPSSNTLTSADVPKEFRIVAVGEAPEALVDPWLYRIPRSGTPRANTDENDFLTNGRLDFGIRPIGNFAFTPVIRNQPQKPDSGLMFTWLGNIDWQARARDFSAWNTTGGGRWGRPMEWKTGGNFRADFNGSYQWSQDIPNNKINRFINNLYTLFWNFIPFYDVDATLMARLPFSIPAMTVSLIPMSGVPTGGFNIGDGVIPVPSAPLPLGTLTDPGLFRDYGGIGMQPLAPPSDWNLYANKFVQEGFIEGDSPRLPANVADTPRIGNVSGLPYPYCPDPDRIKHSGNFSIDHLPGANNPIMARGYQQHLFIMTDADGGSPRVTTWSDASLLSSLPGVPTSQNYGNAQNARVLDRRGTELLFTLGDNNLFREPTTLYQPGSPASANFRAGPSNFYNSNGYSGMVRDSNSRTWLGFPMGELPKQMIVVAKTSLKTRRSFYNDNNEPLKGGYVNVDQSGMSIDLITDLDGRVVRTATPLANGFGVGWDGAPPAAGGTPVLYPEFGGSLAGVSHVNYLVNPLIPDQRFAGLPAGVNAGPAVGYRLRYFLIPTNLAGVQRTNFTIKLQYKNPQLKKWVTYDEKFMTINSDWDNRSSMLPVVGSKEVVLRDDGDAFTPGPNHGNPEVNGNIMPWGTPLITSYDPRGSRFGNPGRAGSNGIATVKGSKASYQQLLAPSADNPSGLTSGINGKSDRPGATAFDQPVGGAPQTVVATYETPASMTNWLLWNGNGPTLYYTYQNWNGEISSANEPDGKSWAMAPDGRTASGKFWVEPPTANANDYGWYPRASGQFRPMYTTRGQINGKKKFPGTDGPNFMRQPTGAVGADFKGAVYGLHPDGDNWAKETPPIADALRIGSLSENVAPSASNPYAQAYADADDVIRRAGGAYAGGDTGSQYTGIDGLPMAEKGTGSADPTTSGTRPVILNRPFRSVAELGYAFRGLPWKQLSFFTPETGDAALLDVFCLSEPPPIPVEGVEGRSANPVVAGKVNLNTRQLPVLHALLAGALKDELDKTGTISNSEAEKAAQALLKRTTGSDVWNGPLTNVSELAGKLIGKDLQGIDAKAPVYTSTVSKTDVWVAGTIRNKDMALGRDELSWHYSGYSADLDEVFTETRDRKNQRRRESVMRALVDGGQTRVWNLMVDLIVQTGKLPTSANDLTRFAKEGEARVWVHLAIDRFTGEILDKQMEWVPE